MLAHFESMLACEAVEAQHEGRLFEALIGSARGEEEMRRHINAWSALLQLEDPSREAMQELLTEYSAIYREVVVDVNQEYGITTEAEFRSASLEDLVRCTEMRHLILQDVYFDFTAALSAKLREQEFSRFVELCDICQVQY